MGRGRRVIDVARNFAVDTQPIDTLLDFHGLCRGSAAIKSYVQLFRNGRVRSP